MAGRLVIVGKTGTRRVKGKQDEWRNRRERRGFRRAGGGRGRGRSGQDWKTLKIT